METLQQKAMRELEQMLPVTTEDVLTAELTPEEQTKWDELKRLAQQPSMQTMLTPEVQTEIKTQQMKKQEAYTTGRYAQMRLEYLEQQMPKLLEYLTENKLLNAHLAQVQESVETGCRRYIRNLALQDEEWLKAIETDSFIMKNQLFSNYQMTAEEELTRIWIYTEPEETE